VSHVDPLVEDGIAGGGVGNVESKMGDIDISIDL
jgi:hypothetical protein